MRRVGGLKILITNLKLENWAGTELFVRDLARGLLDAGHRPVVYSPRLGKLATEIRKETVPVVDDLNQLAVTPDVIHGQHANETLTALLHFSQTPAVYFCHDWYFKDDRPPMFPRILRYVAVDEQCFDKLTCELGVPEDRARVVSQFVDLERFRPRASLPAKPRRAAILCNYTKENEHLQAARKACAEAGIELDVYGLGVGRVCERPEEVVLDYDIVFAKGRAALEAISSGAGVIIYWWRRLGPMVKLGSLERLRRDGFGLRAMGPELTPEEFEVEIGRAIKDYDPADAAAVNERVRSSAGLEAAISELVGVYEEVIAEYAAAPRPDPALEARAAAKHLRDLSLSFWMNRKAIDNTTPFLVTKRLKETPVVGRVVRGIARKFAGMKDGEQGSER